MKKVISLLLVCCFLCMALVACGGKEDETVKPTEGGSKELGTDPYGQPLFQSAVPVDQLDYQGEEVVLMVRDSEDMIREFGRETDTPDELDQRIATRNTLVQEQLGLVVRMEQITNSTSFDTYRDSTFNPLITTSSDEYDIVANFAYAAAYPVIRDYQMNLLNKEVFPWFNFELPCWNQAIVKNLTANNKLYIVAGDLNLSLFDKTMLIWHNKDLYDQRKTEDDPEDLQDLALDYEWYFDELARWETLADTNDAEHKCKNVHGFANDTHFYDTIPHAWDLNLVTTTNEGRYQFNIKENRKAEDALGMVRDFMGKGGILSGSNILDKKCTCEAGFIKHFAGGTLMFMAATLYNGKEGTNTIREMEDKFCVLPIPLYDENHSDYGTTSGDSYNLMTVMRNSSVDADGDRISAYLQLSTELSYTDVRAYYFKGIIEPRMLGGSEANEDGTVDKSIMILNIIVDNLEFDLATIYSASLNDVGWLWRDNVDKTTSLSSAFESNANSGGGAGTKTEAQYEAAIDDFNDWIFSSNE